MGQSMPHEIKTKRQPNEENGIWSLEFRENYNKKKIDFPSILLFVWPRSLPQCQWQWQSQGAQTRPVSSVSPFFWA